MIFNSKLLGNLKTANFVHSYVIRYDIPISVLKCHTPIIITFYIDACFSQIKTGMELNSKKKKLDEETFATGFPLLLKMWEFLSSSNATFSREYFLKKKSTFSVFSLLCIIKWSLFINSGWNFKNFKYIHVNSDRNCLCLWHE